MAKLKAIIWVPEEDRDRWEARCLDQCQRKGYEVTSLIVGGEERWPIIFDAFKRGVIDVCVVPSRSQFATRVPRLEAVTEEIPRVPDQRRTGRVRRWRR